MPCVSRAAALAVAALPLALWASAAPAEPPDRAATLLRASIFAPKTVSYVGQLQTVRFSSNKANATIVRIEHRAPGLTRRWFLAPEAVYGDYIITRGTATYQFDTKHAKVTISHNPALDNQVAATGNLGLVMQNYRPVIGADVVIADRKTTSVLLINKYTGEQTLRVWIDQQTHLVLKKEEYHGNGAVASQTRFEELRYTNGIPGQIFSTQVPPGYAQVAGQDIAMPSSDIEREIHEAGFTPAGPRDLPQGFALVGADATTVNSVKSLHLTYSDGLRTISLFENATNASADFGNLRPKPVRIHNVDAQYVEDGPTTLVTWQGKGLHFALVGDLLRSELVDIAKSVTP